jgi:hypothetical protein
MKAISQTSPKEIPLKPLNSSSHMLRDSEKG